MKLSQISQFIGEDTQQLHWNVSVAVAHSVISSVCNLPPHHRYLQGPACVCHLLYFLWRADDTWATIRIFYHFRGAFLPLVFECLQEMKLQLSLEEWWGLMFLKSKIMIMDMKLKLIRFEGLVAYRKQQHFKASLNLLSCLLYISDNGSIILTM